MILGSAVSHTTCLSMSSTTTYKFAHILPPSWKTQVTTWLQEDTPTFDYAGYVVGEAEKEAELVAMGDTTVVLAGVPFVEEIFNHLGCRYVK